MSDFLDPVDCSMTGFPVLHYLPKFAQTLVHWDSDNIQPSHLLLPQSPPALNLSQYQGLFQRVGSSHQVAKVLDLQLQHQSCHIQWWKTESFSSNVRKKTKMPDFTTSFNIALECLQRAIRQEKEIKGIHIGKEKVKWCLFTDDIIL